MQKTTWGQEAGQKAFTETYEAGRAAGWNHRTAKIRAERAKATEQARVDRWMNKNVGLN